jgi:glucose/arabinose dehydrogenase
MPAGAFQDPSFTSKENRIMRWAKVALATAVIILSLGPPALAQVVTNPFPPVTKGTIRIEVQTVASGLGAPNYLTPSPDTTNRLFITDQAGRIRLIQNNQLVAQPVLDVSARLAINANNRNDERGLLGLAFHPGFADPASPGFRRLYTYTSELVAGTPDYAVPLGAAANHHAVIAEWQVSATNPNVVDVSTRREILRIGEPQANHNGGALAFGPDRYLYISLGDGGAANDVGAGHVPGGNAQDVTTANVLGKILRIDPLNPTSTPTSTDPISANGRYRNPATNPFVGPTPGADEIFAYGLRNPFRMGFDTATGRLIVGDVGQGQIEEVNIVTRGSNLGWPIREGQFAFNQANGQISIDTVARPNLTNPVIAYDHSEGVAIIGGFVYHGTAIPELQGKYIFAELGFPNATQGLQTTGIGLGRLFYGDLETGAMFELAIGLDDRRLGFRVLGFGQDAQGEIYVLASRDAPGGLPSGTDGVVFRIVNSGATAFPEPSSLTLLGLGAAGLLGYAWRRRRRTQGK